MYSYEEKRRAVELYIRYDKSCAAVINELGYPSRGALLDWYKDYLEHGEIREVNRYRRYTNEQKRAAVEHYFKHGRCVARTMRALGYPGSKELLSGWIDELAPDRRKTRPAARSFTYEQKRDAVVALESRNGSAKEVAAQAGVTRCVLYKWKRQLLGKEAVHKMMADVTNLPDDADELRAEVASLEKQVRELELKKAILEGTVELLGKEPGADPNRLTNREKTLLVDSLRSAHKLRDLLAALSMPRSSYQYQVETMRHPDKHADLRARVADLFTASDGRYGYRRIHLNLRSEGIKVSEKVVARVMREDGLVAKRGKRRRYSSYKGEVSDAPENLINRDFRASSPNEKWLTDITEFRIPAGKLYLSPIIDCFDGMVVSWSMSTSPSAELANLSLAAAISTLDGSERPICHSDRGCHYRWPGWMGLCERAGVTRSMSKKGCSPDNSACEGFFGRLKVEMFYGLSWKGWSVEEFIAEVDRYINWYNKQRIKTSLGGLSPVGYREKLGIAA